MLTETASEFTAGIKQVPNFKIKTPKPKQNKTIIKRTTN
jgi:hypothetical protein